MRLRIADFGLRIRGPGGSVKAEGLGDGFTHRKAIVVPETPLVCTI